MQRIAIIGDLIVDHTVFVEPSKIAQEAPIIAYRVLGEEFRNGGAGAVCDMAQALGVDARMIILKSATNIPVSRKTRLVCHGSRNPTIVARFDADARFEWGEGVIESVIEKTVEFDPTAIVISDYGKGTVTPGLVRQLRTATSAAILVDPYTVDWENYDGGHIIAPSRVAAEQFLADEDLRGFDAVIPKLDRDGCRLYGAGPVVSFGTQARSVADVTGAGDQFLATLAAHIGIGISLQRAVWIANLAAGMQVERAGIKPVKADELKTRIAQSDELALATADA